MDIRDLRNQIFNPILWRDYGRWRKDIVGL